MALTQKSVRIDRILYDKCRCILAKLGMPMSVGINIFLEYLVREQGMSFLNEMQLSGVTSTTISKCINVDETLYDSTREILSQSGLSLSRAMNLYFEAIAETQGIPFELKLTDEGEQA